MTVSAPPRDIVSASPHQAEGAGRTIRCISALPNGGDGRLDSAGAGGGCRCRDRDRDLLVVVAGQQDAGAGEEARREGVERDPEEGLVGSGPRGGNGFRVDRHGGLLGWLPGFRLMSLTLWMPGSRREVADRPGAGENRPRSMGPALVARGAVPPRVRRRAGR